MLPKLEEQKKAVELRKTGESIKNIAKILGVSPSSVSLWTKDITLNDDQKAKLLAKNGAAYFTFTKNASLASKAIQKKCKELRESYQEQGREDAKHFDPLHIQGCMLYWGEGGKNANVACLDNTDVHLLKCFVRFLKHCYHIKNSEIKVSVRAHANGKTLDEIQKYWLDALNLPHESLTTASFYYDGQQKKAKRKKNKHIYGACRVSVNSTEIVQRIYGAIQEYGGFSSEEWLETNYSKRKR